MTACVTPRHISTTGARLSRTRVRRQGASPPQLAAAVSPDVDKGLAAVAHGTVAALYVARLWAMDGRAGDDLWARLSLLPLVVVRAPGLAAPLVVERVN